MGRIDSSVPLMSGAYPPAAGAGGAAQEWERGACPAPSVCPEVSPAPEAMANFDAKTE